MKKIVVLNHKSYLNYDEAKKYPIEINDYIRTDQTVIICPSSIYIPYYKGKYNFKLGSQSISTNNITGELTGNTLKSIDIKYVLIGSHDRKNYYEEDINKQIKESLSYNIRPIIIVGETFYEYELKKTINIIKRQIKDYLEGIEVEQDMILCYAPNWTYKGKQIPKIEYIIEVTEFIKNMIKRQYNMDIKLLYGGNVYKENIQDLEKIKNIDGYIIGEASTDLNEIKTIFNKME